VKDPGPADFARELKKPERMFARGSRRENLAKAACPAKIWPLSAGFHAVILTASLQPLPERDSPDIAW